MGLARLAEQRGLPIRGTATRFQLRAVASRGCRGREARSPTPPSPAAGPVAPRGGGPVPRLPTVRRRRAAEAMGAADPALPGGAPPGSAATATRHPGLTRSGARRAGADRAWQSPGRLPACGLTGAQRGPWRAGAAEATVAALMRRGPAAEPACAGEAVDRFGRDRRRSGISAFHASRLFTKQWPSAGGAPPLAADTPRARPRGQKPRARPRRSHPSPLTTGRDAAAQPRRQHARGASWLQASMARTCATSIGPSCPAVPVAASASTHPRRAHADQRRAEALLQRRRDPY